MTLAVELFKLKKSKIMKCIFLMFIGLLAVTACEFNDKVERVSTSGLDTINFDSVVVVDVDGYETDHYDSTLQKWVGTHADRLNGVDLSPVE